jgi:hypothetical protein
LFELLEMSSATEVSGENGEQWRKKIVVVGLGMVAVSFM